MHPDLAAYIRRYIQLSDEEFDLFLQHLKPKTVSKKDFLLRAGETCKSRYFITKGCLRLYYIDQKDNEQIIHFGIDNWWISDYQSLINQQPSNLYIQALENTQLLELHNDSFERLSAKLPKTERLFRIIMEKTYVAIQQRMEYMFSMSGEELYNYFVDHNKAFAQRVPQYMIASYLGMTPEFVSKVRRKKD